MKTIVTTVAVMPCALTVLGALCAVVCLVTLGLESSVVSVILCRVRLAYTAVHSPPDCSNGDVRLMNGSVPSAGQREGRVEICYQNVYGSVCDDFFNESAAAVVCNGTGMFKFICEMITL